MAEQNNNNITTNSFTKGLQKDLNDTFVDNQSWTHARNAVNNSHDGELGVLGNEPSNIKCVDLPYTLIGAISIEDDEWAVFTTDDVNSEIGIFNEANCTYTKVVNNACLNFSTKFPIIGAYKKRFDCGKEIYWDDSNNPSRKLNLADVPYVCFDATEEIITNYYSYNIRRKINPNPTVPCGQSFSFSGSQGRYIYNVDLGTAFGVVTLNYNTLAIPDRFIIEYAGTTVLDTGYRGFPMFNDRLPEPVRGPAVGSASFHKLSTERVATITVEAPLPGTAWSALLSCPVPDGSEPPAPPTPVSVKYTDKNNVEQSLDLDYGENINVCALDNSIVIAHPEQYVVTKGAVCHTTSKTQVKKGCAEKVCTTELNCEALRLAAILDVPCLSLRRGKASGTLANGSYQAVIAYTVNDIRVTDYLAQSEVQPIFSHQNLSGSLELDVSNLDQDYGEFELVLITTINQQTVAKRVGIYSTRSTTIYVDTIDPTLPTIPLNLIPLRTYAIDKSDGMYAVNNYLLRVGIYTKPDFNYQIQANKIISKWVSVRYPADYYHKGGNKASYMRDEQYVFFIRFIYNTGDKSASYSIPGRAPVAADLDPISNADALESQTGGISKRWQVYNTATVTNLAPNITLPDGGVVISEGLTGYYESTELYPSDQPEIWGDLCSKNIRLHKFPDNTVHPSCNHFNPGGESINILGVKFENITPPVDNDGNVIESIVGYEILRGSREGHRTIIAKGLISNMRQYNIDGNNNVKGLYANYPYNDLRPDYFLTSNKGLSRKGPSGGDDSSVDPLRDYRQDVFSFHSPDTTFSKPFLSASELTVYEEVHGKARGSFEIPYKHPKQKLATGFSDTITKVVGVINTIGTIVGAVAGADGTLQLQGTDDLPFTNNLLLTHRAEMMAGSWFGLSSGFLNNVGAPGAGGIAAGKRQIANTAITTYNVAMVVALSTVTASATSEKLFNVIMGLIPTIQYALQYNSHGLYDQVVFTDITANHRRVITDSNYVGSNSQTFTGEFRINNIFRPNYVVLKVGQNLANPSVQDNSRNRIKGDNFSGNPLDTFESTISSHYAALKTNLPSQYGQIGSVKQIPISTCVQKTSTIVGAKYKSDIFFGGDVYVNRFTEKNSYFFFNDWLLGQPDEFEYDYRNYQNGPYPRYWVNFERGNYSLFGSNTTSQRHLNARESSTFYVKKGYFYLFCNGVRDFFVESEVNVALRDWEEQDSKRHYDPYEYTDLSSLMRSDIIKSNNFYKYDYSLSNTRIFNSYITWGEVLPRDYDPLLAESCFSYYPKRIHYSLPQELEFKKDNWSSFLVNNYKDMPSDVTSIKSIGKSGALIMMKSQSPLQFAGVDELQTTSGTKITIGDGGLFARPLQNLVNADMPYEYGSSQSQYATIGTPQGVFYISQNQGKIFNYNGKLEEISRAGNKYWFSQYLPSFLLKDFPQFELTDNPIIGVGCQAIYDNTNEVVYFTKKDFKVRDQYKAGMTYIGSNMFMYDGYQVTLGDETYFENASWTMSYDPKQQQWLSHHDWHPTFLIPGRNHFHSVNKDSIWNHNIACDSYCNYYGKDYPFEIEFVASTGQTVNTVKSVEYLLECYKYSNNCQDRFHILDYNFDRAIVYNSEQNSGMLRLNISPKNNPVLGLQYPKVGLNFIDILYSKEENKYRFDQFYDVTKDRGEFTGNDLPMFITQTNGYIYKLNDKYLNYSKEPTQHKKFRHYSNRVFLRRVSSGDVKMNFKLINTKTLVSPR